MSLSIANTFHNNPVIWAQEFNKGSKAALHHLFHAFHPELVYFLRNIVDSPEIAEEIADDSFVKVWHKPDKRFKSLQEAKAWLIRVSQRAALNHLKLKGRQETRHDLYLTNQDGDSEDNLSYSYENQLIKAMLLRETLEALKHLGEQQRIVILLALEGTETAQIAQIMSLPEQTVRNYRSKAIQNLQKHLSKMAFLFLLFYLLQGKN